MPDSSRSQRVEERGGSASSSYRAAGRAQSARGTVTQSDTTSIKTYGSGYVNTPLPPASSATHHRRYSPVYKCANRLLAKRWDDAARDRHKEKVASIRPAVDNSPPKRYSHLDLRLKKIHQDQEQSQKVQSENMILLHRMAKQMSAPRGFSNLDEHSKVKDVPKKPHPSARRRQEQQRHVKEANVVYQQRIEERQPFYSRTAWSEERKKNLSYLANHSRFPETYIDVCEKEGVQLPFIQPRPRSSPSRASPENKRQGSDDLMIYGSLSHSRSSIHQQD
ncbi:hypothetical protein DFS34DRAFT_358533 [Phlyctochytrium arcticum]|nr:hypothetical protein DFS34DRAFT_358533 [Phlyctochytrium arcticum]